jgi:hypothetical protein
MKRRIERIGVGAVALLGAMVLLGASGALAVTIPNDVYTLPVDPPPVNPTVDLQDDSPFPGLPRWVRLRPEDPFDTVEDYTDLVLGQAVSMSGPPTPGDPWIFNIQFRITWNGTINDQIPIDPVSSQMLFAIVDSRYVDPDLGPVFSFETTRDLPLSGFVRESDPAGFFYVNGVPVVPEIILDDTGRWSGDPEGWVRDTDPFAPSADPINRWLGFYLPATPGATNIITMRWAVGEDWGGTDIFYPNRLFMATVPEPGTGALLGVALLGLGAIRMRRRAA